MSGSFSVPRHQSADDCLAWLLARSALPVLLVLLLLNCADLLPSPIDFFVFVFMVFFFCSAVRLLSVALHEKAEAPALPRGSSL